LGVSRYTFQGIGSLLHRLVARQTLPEGRGRRFIDLPLKKAQEGGTVPLASDPLVVSESDHGGEGLFDSIGESGAGAGVLDPFHDVLVAGIVDEQTAEVGAGSDGIWGRAFEVPDPVHDASGIGSNTLRFVAEVDHDPFEDAPHTAFEAGGESSGVDLTT
jgi:hypothetical protein